MLLGLVTVMKARIVPPEYQDEVRRGEQLEEVGEGTTLVGKGRLVQWYP